jgi:hypothetical protein
VQARTKLLNAEWEFFFGSRIPAFDRYQRNRCRRLPGSTAPQFLMLPVIIKHKGSRLISRRWCMGKGTEKPGAIGGVERSK